MTLTRYRRDSRRSALAERISPSYEVEATPLYGHDGYPESETWECMTEFQVGIRLEDLLGLNPLEVAAELVLNGEFHEVDRERDIEVTVRRA